MSAEGEAGAADQRGSKGPLFLALLNTLAIIAVLGGMAYVFLFHNRPAITEKAERERLNRLHAEARVQPTEPPGRLDFERATVNIKAPSGSASRLQYALVRFSLQLKAKSMEEKIEPYRAVILDKVLRAIGNKGFEELSTVQGRYLLKSETLKELNEMARFELKMDIPVFTQLHFSEFIVQ